MDKKGEIKIICETEGLDEATEKVEALADAFNEFPPQVQLKNCRDCNITIYPSQTKVIEMTGGERKGSDQVEKVNAKVVIEDVPDDTDYCNNDCEHCEWVTCPKETFRKVFEVDDDVPVIIRVQSGGGDDE